MPFSTSYLQLALAHARNSRVKKTVNNNYLRQPCAYQRACELKLPIPRDDYRFQRLILQFLALGKKYRIASMFIITRPVSTPRDVERRESGSMFCETIEIIP